MKVLDGGYIEATGGDSIGGQRWEVETRISTHRARRTVATVALNFVTKILHCSMAGTTEAEEKATIIFLAALEYDEQTVKSG